MKKEVKFSNKTEIPYKYFEMVSLSEINELYNILDIYIVSSRIEGGPQAIVECAISETPIVSTNVGIAPEITAVIFISLVVLLEDEPVMEILRVAECVNPDLFFTVSFTVYSPFFENVCEGFFVAVLAPSLKSHK